jgi:predicted acylesterase/phospholipase RssA
VRRRSPIEGLDAVSHLDTLIDAPGPKKLLAIDGGGIRGLIAIEFLAKIESLLRERFDRPDLVLSQYFDYVAGTSTGAIIATLVSLGYSTEEIRSFYKTGAHAMFDPNAFQRIARRTKGPVAVLMGVIGMLIYKAMYTPVPLEREIKQVLGDPLPDGKKVAGKGPLTTFGTEKLRTLLMMVTRNASTDSHWPISNNPRAKYNVRVDSDGKARATNLDIPLWQLIRASTAAPVFFPPEEIHVPGVKKPFMFMDGGITVYNNPAFQLFLMATLPTYNLRWPAGEKELLLVSVGTGLCESANLNLGEHQMNLMYNVQSTPAALMRAATVEQDILCRVVGRVRPGCNLPEIDSEIGDLVDSHAPLARKLFSYARYNVELSDKGLQELGLYDPGKMPCGIEPKSVQPLDNVDHLGELERVGKAAAERCISIEDFEGFLDVSALRQSREAPPLGQDPVLRSESEVGNS